VFEQEWAGRGAAFGDIDNDGDVDIVVSNLGQRAYVLRNDGGNINNWICIEPQGTKSNRDGIGARIKVISDSGVQYFSVNTAVGYLSASDKRVVVGLGKDTAAKLVEIRWPSGIVQKFENVKSRQILKAIEPHP
jgi:enediyne biosynthesis protein E4